MNIAFCARPDLETHQGGDTIQILKTKEYLEKLGINIKIIYNLDEPFSSYDLIHIFNIGIINPTYEFANFFHERKIPYLISPIYWDTYEFEKKILSNISIQRKIYYFIKEREIFENFFATIFKNSMKNRNFGSHSFEKRKYCLENASAILPNSKGENNILNKVFGSNYKSFIIPNAVDINIQPADFEALKKKYKLPDRFTLCVGRIEYRKNQYQVIKAINELKINLILIGRINNHEDKYWKSVQKIMNTNIIHIERLSQSEIFSLYGRADSHILASWFETPGLSSLEAAYNGCQIVTTDRGSAKEYFGDFAFYCQPDDYNSIRQAIINSIEKPKDIHAFREIIRKNYSWEETAKKSLEAYKNILKANKSH